MQNGFDGFTDFREIAILPRTLKAEKKVMEISLVIPTYNRLNTVSRSLELLFSQKVAPDSFEIVVVVDGSTDGTADALRKLKPPCPFRVIEQENRGLAGARNTGYRAAASKLVLFLDDDMLCDPELIATHLEAHKGQERIVAFGALFLSSDSVKNIAAECFNREIGRLHLENSSGRESEWRESDCVFSNTSLPKSLLEEFGGFDERFRMHEDLEFGYRLFRANVMPKYIPEAIAYQYYDKSSADLVRDAERFAESDLLFARLHPGANIDGQLRSMKRNMRLKTKLLKAFAGYPKLMDMLLGPACILGDQCFGVPFLRRSGIRALQLRRRIHWMHRVLELDPSAMDQHKNLN